MVERVAGRCYCRDYPIVRALDQVVQITGRTAFSYIDSIATAALAQLPEGRHWRKREIPNFCIL
jgi:hypothetical protein